MSLIGRRVRLDFDGNTYYGTIVFHNVLDRYIVNYDNAFNNPFTYTYEQIKRMLIEDHFEAEFHEEDLFEI